MPGWQPHDYSEQTAREIDCALRGIVEATDNRFTAARVHLLVAATGKLRTENDRSLVQCLLAARQPQRDLQRRRRLERHHLVTGQRSGIDTQVVADDFIVVHRMASQWRDQRDIVPPRAEHARHVQHRSMACQVELLERRVAKLNRLLEETEAELQRAVELAPENPTYSHNLSKVIGMAATGQGRRRRKPDEGGGKAASESA